MVGESFIDVVPRCYIPPISQKWFGNIDFDLGHGLHDSESRLRTSCWIYNFVLFVFKFPKTATANLFAKGCNLSIIMGKQDSEHGSQYFKHSTTCKGNLNEEMT